MNDRKMRDLYLCLSNDLRGVNLIEMDDYEGYRIVDAATGWTLYTAYCAQDGYSCYRAVPDIHKGIDIEDEKPLLVKAALFAVVSRIKSDAGMCDPFIPVDCGRAYSDEHAYRAALAKLS